MNKKVLIIDDEPSIGEMLTNLLESHGYIVSTALDGPTGLAEIERNPPHVLLLDYMLPGMDGIEVLCEARHHWPNLPVIMITGYSSPDLHSRAIKFSVLEVVTKPFDTDKLLQVLEKATSGK
jgi:DNA-binding response OmpR family regulator